MTYEGTQVEHDHDEEREGHPDADPEAERQIVPAVAPVNKHTQMKDTIVTSQRRVCVRTHSQASSRTISSHNFM